MKQESVLRSGEGKIGWPESDNLPIVQPNKILPSVHVTLIYHSLTGGPSLITSMTGGILQVETEIVLAVDAMLFYSESKRNKINIWVLEN